jgi:hypothetical protein
MKLYNKRNNNVRFIIWVSIMLTHILIINNLSAQYQQEWIKKVTGSGSNSADYGNNIAFDKQNNVYVAGYIQNSGTSYDYFLIKYTPAGFPIWNRTYNGLGNNWDVVNSLVIDDFGNAYVTGYSRWSNAGDDCVTVKYDSSGNLKWVKVYDFGGNLSDRGRIVMVDNNQNVYVAGESYYSEQNMDYLLIKYDSLGTQKWVRRFRGDWYNNYLKDMVLDKSGNIYVTGNYFKLGIGMVGMTIKYTPNGDSLWSRGYNYNSFSNDLLSIAVDSIGNVCVTGSAYDNVNNNTTLITLKYDSLGVLLWAKSYQNNTTSFTDYGSCIGVDKYNNIYVTGYTAVGPDNVSNRDYLTIRYKPNGDTSWVRKYNGPGNNFDTPYKLTIDRQGNVFVTGASYGGGLADYFTISYDTLGNVIWSNRYNGTANGYDDARYVALDNAQNLYITGDASETVTGRDLVTIKYSKNVGIQNINENIPDNYVMFQNYPNPFNPSTTIKFELPKTTDVKVAVYDITGKELEVLVNEKLQTGTYQTTWNGERYSSGVYFYKIQTDDFVQTKRMVLIK